MDIVPITRPLASMSISIAIASTLANPSWTQSDAQTVLAGATDAAKSLRTVTYEGRMEIRSSSSQQIITGDVSLARFDFSNTIGGKVLLRGEVQRGDSVAQPFQTTYDGQTVQRLLPERKVLMQSDLHFGGSGIFSGPGQRLLLKQMIAADPFVDERAAPTVSYMGQDTVDGELCDVIAVQYKAPHTNARWYFSTKDHLPRKHERHYRSARGNDVTAVLTLKNIRLDVTLDDALFTIAQPDGYRLEILGKKPPPPLNVGDLAPNWTLTDGDGHPRSLSDYRGKLVVLDFWATWCRYCKKAMPALQELHDEFADEGVVILGVNCRDKPEVDPAAFMRDRGYSYPVLLDGNSIAIAYQLRGIPAFYVISPDGRLMFKRSGFSAQQERWLRGVIEQYVKQHN